jgi:hypothetical protein
MKLTQQNNEYLPICYRCDNKYKYFLLNSIKSLLKYYKGDLIPYFYICTTEKDFEIKEVLELQNKYNFKIEIINFNEAFLEKHSLHACFPFIQRKNYRFLQQELSKLKKTDCNQTTCQFNPFHENKAIFSHWILFIATTQHKKVILLDTDTIIVDNIIELYKTDVDTVCVALRPDWGQSGGKLNPSVSVVNIERSKNILFKKDGLIASTINYINNPTKHDCSYGLYIQHETSRLLEEDKYIILDPAWNVPITHMHEFTVKPKIYHFSESRYGHKKILQAYEHICNKFLSDHE